MLSTSHRCSQKGFYILAIYWAEQAKALEMSNEKDEKRIIRYPASPPSEVLADLSGDPDVLSRLGAVLNGQLHPCDASPRTRAWKNSCYNDPSNHELILSAANELLGGYGVEGLPIDDAPNYTDGGTGMCPPFSYVNNGDSYTATLARDHRASAWVVASWADLLEEYEKENNLAGYERFARKPKQCVACHARPDAITLESFGAIYAWVCVSCNHHHMTPDDFDPAALQSVQENDEDDDTD